MSISGSRLESGIIDQNSLNNRAISRFPEISRDLATDDGELWHASFGSHGTRGWQACFRSSRCDTCAAMIEAGRSLNNVSDTPIISHRTGQMRRQHIKANSPAASTWRSPSSINRGSSCSSTAWIVRLLSSLLSFMLHNTPFSLGCPPGRFMRAPKESLCTKILQTNYPKRGGEQRVWFSQLSNAKPSHRAPK